MWTTTLILLVIIFACALMWRNNLRVREQALKIAEQTCTKLNVQFLDETVALKKVRLSRSDRGTVCFMRYYEFEYSTNNIDRKICTLQMRGFQLSQILYADKDEHTTVVSSPIQAEIYTKPKSYGTTQNTSTRYTNNVISFAQYKPKNDTSKKD